MPARSNSLFFAGRVSLFARCLRSSSTRYSAFGIVKLSRTNFGFLLFSSFSALVNFPRLMLALVFASMGLVAACLGTDGIAAVFAGVFKAGLAGDLTSDSAAGLAPDLISPLAGTLTTIAFFTAGLAALDFLAAGEMATVLVVAVPLAIALVFASNGCAAAGLVGNGVLAVFMKSF